MYSADELHLEIDDFTDPWEPSETILMIHGLAESGEAFRGWVPRLSRHFRVARLDLRGFGRSPAVPVHFPWSVERVLQDIDEVIDRLDAKRVHLVGGKIGGTFAMRYAAMRPDRVQSLILVSAPVSLTGLKEQAAGWRSHIARDGVHAWAKATMRTRMGSQMSEAALAWWADLMGATSAETLEGFLRMVPSVDATDSVPEIKAPALVIASEASPLEPLETVRAWSAKLPSGRLEVLPGDSYHLAAAAPDECARMAFAFLRKSSGFVADDD
jgi:3-oxoadipate enol-lactonase